MGDASQDGEPVDSQHGEPVDSDEERIKAMKKQSVMNKFVDSVLSKMPTKISNEQLKDTVSFWEHIDEQFDANVTDPALRTANERGYVLRAWLNRKGLHKRLDEAWERASKMWNKHGKFTEPDVKEMKKDITKLLLQPSVSLGVLMVRFFTTGELSMDPSKFYTALDKYQRDAKELLSRLEGDDDEDSVIVQHLIDANFFLFLSRNAQVWSIIRDDVLRYGNKGDFVRCDLNGAMESLGKAHTTLSMHVQLQQTAKVNKRRELEGATFKSDATPNSSSKKAKMPKDKRGREDDEDEVSNNEGDHNGHHSHGGSQGGGRGGRGGGRAGRGGQGGGRGGRGGGRGGYSGPSKWCNYHRSRSHNTEECTDAPPEFRNPANTNPPPAAASESVPQVPNMSGAKPAAPRGKPNFSTFSPRPKN